MKCSYGCNQEAKYTLKNGKFCCSEKFQYCPYIRLKIRNKKLGSKLSEETKQKMSTSQKGIKLTKKTKIKISLSKKGKNNPNYGKKFSCETKKKMSEAHKGEKSPLWRGGYAKNNIPRYDKYNKQISFIETCRRNLKDKNILEMKCTYCGKWFIPKLNSLNERCRSIKNGIDRCRLYCSNKCKIECPIFNQTLYPKGFKPATSREVQPELRQMRFEIDKYTCQKCGKHQDELETGLHCHHIEGIRWEPLESADVDKVITLCKKCHKEVHKQEDCKYNDLKCKSN